MYTTKQRVTNRSGSSGTERAKQQSGEDRQRERDSVGSNNSEWKRSIKH